MPSYKEMVLSHFDARGVYYAELNSDVDNTVRVVFAGNNVEQIRIRMAFDSDGESLVRFACEAIGRFVNKEEGYDRCNEANSRWRWVRFHINEDGEIIADLDAYLVADSCGEECYFLLRQLVRAIDEAFPLIARRVY